LHGLFFEVLVLGQLYRMLCDLFGGEGAEAERRLDAVGSDLLQLAGPEAEPGRPMTADRTRSRSLDKVLEKIRKLIALEASPNKHEADVAHKTAERLLKKHGLTRDEVARMSADGYAEVPMGARGFDEAWRWALVTTASRYCGAEAVALMAERKHRPPRRKVRLVGERADVERAKALYGELCELVTRLEQVAADRLLGLIVEWTWRYTPEECADSFRRGVVMGIAARMAAHKKAGGQDDELWRSARDEPPAAKPAGVLGALVRLVGGARERTARARETASRVRGAPQSKSIDLDDAPCPAIYEMGLDLARACVRVSPEGKVELKQQSQDLRGEQFPSAGEDGR
jgi:hypothetical protein